MSDTPISVIVCTARPKGLIPVLRGLVKQSVDFELVLVDAFCEERRELVYDFWQDWGTKKLVHVPPLPLLPSRTERHCWDIPLYYNTGWCYASGKIVVHLEDFMSPTDENWLINHALFVEKHRNFASIGHVTDPQGISHYNRPPPLELQRDWLRRFPGLKFQLEHPEVLQCYNREAYGSWLSGNTGLWLEHVLKAGGGPEWPTHWPESSIAPELFNYGISMWPNEDATAIHFEHDKGGVAGMLMSFDVYGDCIYEPIKKEPMIEIPPAVGPSKLYKRDLIAERKRLDKWVP